MALKAIGLTLLAAAGLAVAFWVHLFFMLTTCSGPTPEVKPAEASPQGWVCGDGYSWLTPMLFGFAAAVLLGVVLTGVVWHHTKAVGVRLLALTLPFAALVPAWVAMSLPPDHCSAETKRERPAYDCETTVDG